MLGLTHAADVFTRSSINRLYRIKDKNHERIMFSWFFHIGWYRVNASNGIINKGLNRMKRNQIGYFSCLEFLVFWIVIIGGFLIITGKLF